VRNAFCITFDRGFFRSLLLYLGYGMEEYLQYHSQIATAWPGNLTDVVSAGRQHTLERVAWLRQRLAFIVSRGLTTKPG